jgi:hypothetical protein
MLLCISWYGLNLLDVKQQGRIDQFDANGLKWGGGKKGARATIVE